MYIKNLADPSNYGGVRKRIDVIAIVLHYVGSDHYGETVRNNLAYFHNNKNLGASAHLFVDDNDWGKSVNLNRVAYTVGKDYRSGKEGEGIFYGIINNQNSVSIEICDFYHEKDLTPDKMKNLKKAIRHVYRNCPNIKYIVRHYDVNGKHCPRPCVKDPKIWNHLISEIVR